MSEGALASAIGVARLGSLTYQPVRLGADRVPGADGLIEGGAAADGDES